MIHSPLRACVCVCALANLSNYKPRSPHTRPATLSEPCEGVLVWGLSIPTPSMSLINIIAGFGRKRTFWCLAGGNQTSQKHHGRFILSLSFTHQSPLATTPRVLLHVRRETRLHLSLLGTTGWRQSEINVKWTYQTLKARSLLEATGSRLHQVFFVSAAPECLTELFAVKLHCG